MSRIEKYMQHTAELVEFDLGFATENIAGIDEVGRGPLAGDVYAACVVLPKEPRLTRVDDSKKLSQKAREEIAKKIYEIAIFCNIGVASVQEIDELNILQATKLAMHRAAEACKADCFLVDAVTGLMLPNKSFSVISGDAKSYNIAAASIVAKVARDNYMCAMAERYPEYNFQKNKGYGTAEHIAAIKKYGPCPLHRKAFIRNFV